MIQFGFTMSKNFPKVKSTKLALEESELVNNQEEVEGEETVDGNLKEFNYLLGISFLSITQEEIEKLKILIEEKRENLKKIQNYDIKDLWREDLDLFL